MQIFTKEAFEILFRNEFKGLCFFAMKYVKDYETSREIVQDSFIRLWEKRDVIDTSKSVKSYLTTSIHNKCLNHLRDNRKFDNNLLQIEQLSEVSDGKTSDFLVEKELRKSIETAIDELPEKCREVFLLSRNENLKYHEIAVQLGISVKTVETQMSKALQHLRLRLSGFMSLLAFFIHTYFR
jgi:RNA polymerase sigma-70 factor (ECF subfamily)